MNFLTDVIFGILLGVDSPINKVLESYSEFIVKESHSEVEGVSFLVETHLVGVSGLHG